MTNDPAYRQANEEVYVNAHEYQLLTEMKQLVDSMFAQADNSDLYIGLGYNPSLSKDKQEGAKVKQLRELRDQLTQVQS